MPLKIEFLGVNQSLKDWSRTLGIPYITIQKHRAKQLADKDADQSAEWLFRTPENITALPRHADGRYKCRGK